MGARESPLGTRYGEYKPSQGYTVRLLRKQTRLSRVRNTDQIRSLFLVIADLGSHLPTIPINWHRMLYKATPSLSNLNNVLTA